MPDNTLHTYHGCPNSQIFEIYTTVKIFTGQGLETNNHMACGVILRKPNKRDSAEDVSRQQQTKWNLRNREREAHSYAKIKNTYYDEQVKQDKKSTKAGEISNQVKLKLNYIHHKPTSSSDPDFLQNVNKAI